MKGQRTIKNFIGALAIAFALCLAGTFSVNTFAATATPTSLTFTENSKTSSTITWKAVSGAKYNVYKAVSRYATYSKVASDVTTTTYTDDAYNGEYYKVTAVVNNSESAKSSETSYEVSKFGYNTYVFEDTDNTTSIQNVINTIFKTTESGQFGTGRYSYLFKPGTYSDSLVVKTGFYTQVAGLGKSPKDTTIGTVDCPAEWMKGRKYDGGVNYNALCNFWRTCENLTTNKSVRWAVSQATSFRRMYVKGDLYLHEEGGYASGGFLADSKITGENSTKTKGVVSAGSQQQWMTRNSEMNIWDGAVWNYVFVGCKTDSANLKMQWPKAPYTVVEKTPEVQEKPFLTVDDNGNYGVFVPELRTDANGVSWDGDEVKGETISLDKFYVAKPGDSAAKINAELAKGLNLVLTPGIYNISEPIRVKNANTIVLGLGLATLKPSNGNQCMVISDVDGVKVAGVLFDAGAKKSASLLTVGESKTGTSHEANPISLSDTFYRVGGADANPSKCTTAVILNSNNVIGDNFWVWRADHGAGVGWYKNTADHGIIVNGDNCTTYGLMVEHFQKQQTVWNGNGGKCYMYQSELPYDIPSQNAWNEAGSYGYTDYQVSSNVKTHEGYGIGIYSCYQAATCFLKSAITCPNTAGVKFTNVCTYSLSGNGGIDYAINKSGYSVLASGDMCKVMSYCNNKYTQDKTYANARKYIWATNITDISKLIYTGKVLTPKITVQYRGITLRPNVDYKLTFKNNKNIGKGSYTISGINGFQESLSYSYKIVPAKAKITKKKVTKKKISIKFKKIKGAKKYQVLFSNKKSFSKKTIITTKKTSVKFKRKNKKAYYVKVRAFKKVGKKTYYGSYSKRIKCK